MPILEARHLRPREGRIHLILNTLEIEQVHASWDYQPQPYDLFETQNS